ncbi:MAG: threonine/serine exporter family protein [Anaerolineae bacterium]|nr:threonine/serine exporter family protein [Anaerolineae bacterium]MDW8172977.1 threonine/serine exporter family protein [Anaerolineae bacterium]
MAEMIEAVIDDDHPHKPPMEREELRDVISLSLWAGQMLLQNGADSQKVEETVHRLGTQLGCDWMDVVVLYDSIIATTLNNREFRTKARRAPGRGVNLEKIVQINDLSYQAMRGELDRFVLRRELRRIDKLSPNYGRWTVVLFVGLACAAFARLFGGDLAAMTITFLAAAIGMAIRQQMALAYFNPILTTIVTAFVASLVASVGVLLKLGAQPAVAISAAVLLLVPGVPLINASEDLLNGQIINGLARGTWGLILSLAIALGIAMTLWLTGIKIAL